MEALRFRPGVLRSWLMAPALGFAIVEICVCNLNQLGNMPVKAFALWLLVFLVCASVAVLRWRKVKFPGRSLAPFGGVLLFSTVYTGWPAFLHGFNWLSFVNGDMTYFASGAVRMLEHPFYSVPPVDQLMGWDYTQYTWSGHVAYQVRSGGEMLLAWCAGISHLNPLQVYMSVILALSLCQLCGLGALIVSDSRPRNLALLSMVLLSVSPLFSLATIYQLLPQMGGLPCMLVIAVLLSLLPERRVWAYCVVLAVAVSGIALHYPEAFAFAVLPVVLLWSIRILKQRQFPTMLLVSAGMAAVLVGVLIRENLAAGIVNTLGNVQSAALTGTTAVTAVYPFFMVPSGLAHLFGFLPIGLLPDDPLLSLIILVSLILLGIVAVQSAFGLGRTGLCASMMAVWVLTGLMFFLGGNDYGLFKLAMFCQPALAGCIAAVLWNLNRGWLLAGVALMFAFTVPTQIYYTKASAGLKAAGVTEVPLASQDGVVFSVPRVTAVSDIVLLPAQGIAGIVFRGSQVLFPSVGLLLTKADKVDLKGSKTVNSQSEIHRAAPAALHHRPARTLVSVNLAGAGYPRARTPEFHKIKTGLPEPHRAAEPAPRASPGVREYVDRFLAAAVSAGRLPARRYIERQNTRDAAITERLREPREAWNSKFRIPAEDVFGAGESTPSHLLSLKRRFLFNGLRELPQSHDYGLFRLTPYPQVKNWLVFIPSSRGPYYYYHQFSAALYQPEADPYKQVSYLSGIGSFVLTEILNPSPAVRVRVSVTRSILGEGRVRLPANAHINGESNVALGLVGAGAANVFSPPVSPLRLGRRFYLAIDMGEPAITFPNRKTGLMRLYNKNWRIDNRAMTAFCRDLSIVSEDEYAALPRPRAVRSFPGDLLNDPRLEFSGIYEDGWVSPDAFIKLGASKSGDRLVVEGSIPGIALQNGSTSVSIEVEGRSETHTLRGGQFQLVRKVTSANQVTAIRMTFSGSAKLATPDDRLVSALLTSISLE